MNRGDTAFLMLNYTINGEPLEEGAYQEIELQLNSSRASVRKTYTNGDIEWKTLTYLDNEGHEQTFEGYICHLNQNDTFKLDEYDLFVQLRIMVDNEVGSSEITNIDLGKVLSNKVLVA